MAWSPGAGVRSRDVATRFPAFPGEAAPPPERRYRLWPGGSGRSPGGAAGFPPGPGERASRRGAWPLGALAWPQQRRAVRSRPAPGGRHRSPGPGARASRTRSCAVSRSGRRGWASRPGLHAVLHPCPPGGAGHRCGPSPSAPVRPAVPSPGPRPAVPHLPCRGRPRRYQPKRLPCPSLVPDLCWPVLGRQPPGTACRSRRYLALRHPRRPRRPRRPRSRSGGRSGRCRRQPERVR